MAVLIFEADCAAIADGLQAGMNLGRNPYAQDNRFAVGINLNF